MVGPSEPADEEFQSLIGRLKTQLEAEGRGYLYRRFNPS